MFWRRRPAPRPTTHPDVHHFRRQLRNIEWALSTLDARNPDHITQVRKLATDHAVYRDCLREHGIIHPAPKVKW